MATGKIYYKKFLCQNLPLKLFKNIITIIWSSHNFSVIALLCNNWLFDQNSENPIET